MRLVFLFMSEGSASPNSTKRKHPKNKCGSQYDVFNNECYFTMLLELKKLGYVKELFIFYESNKNPGLANWVEGENVYCEVIPEIRFVEEYIDEETIIFVRGGFRHWHDFLFKYKEKNWLMIYAANTGREKWTWWDIIFDDLKQRNMIDLYERYFFPFVKPVNESIFYPDYEQEKVYDVCIGASHIHDRKGQWRFVNALIEFNGLFGEMTTIMPGSVRRSQKTLEMINKLCRARFVECPGFVSRKELAKIFNKSKYYFHMGEHGQNDRSPIEALACGTEVILANPSYHAPYFSKIGYKFQDINNAVKTAYDIFTILSDYNKSNRELMEIIYKINNGMDEVVIPRMKALFEVLQQEKKPSMEAKQAIRSKLKNEIS